MRNYRGNSEPPNSCDSDDSDYHDRTTGLRRSGFPIKISGIAMGSQESLNSGEETGPSLWENALHKRRPVRTFTGTNGSKISQEAANYGPFGFGLLTNMQKSKRGLGCNYSTARTKRSSSISNLVNAVEQSQQQAVKNLSSHCSSNASTLERNNNKSNGSSGLEQTFSLNSRREEQRWPSESRVVQSGTDFSDPNSVHESQSLQRGNVETQRLNEQHDFVENGTSTKDKMVFTGKQEDDLSQVPKSRTRNPSEDHLPRLETMGQISSSSITHTNRAHCDEKSPGQTYFQPIGQTEMTNQSVYEKTLSEHSTSSWNTHSESVTSMEQSQSSSQTLEYYSTAQSKSHNEVGEGYSEEQRKKSHNNELQTSWEHHLVLDDSNQTSFQTSTSSNEREHKYLEDISDFGKLHESTNIKDESSFEKSSLESSSWIENTKETHKVSNIQSTHQTQSHFKSEVCSAFTTNRKTMQSTHMNQFQQQELAKVLSQEASKVFQSKVKDNPDTTENDFSAPKQFSTQEQNVEQCPPSPSSELQCEELPCSKMSENTERHSENPKTESLLASFMAQDFSVPFSSNLRRESSVPPSGGDSYHLQRPRRFSGFSNDQANQELVRRFSFKGRSSYRSSESNDNTQMSSESQGKPIIPSNPREFCHQIDLGLNSVQTVMANTDYLLLDDDDDEMLEVNPGDVNIHEPIMVQPLSSTCNTGKARSNEDTYTDEDSNFPLPPYPQSDQIEDKLQNGQQCQDILPQENLTVSKDECLIFDDLFEKLVDDEITDEDLKVKTSQTDTKASSSSYWDSKVQETSYQSSMEHESTSEEMVNESTVRESAFQKLAVQELTSQPDTKIKDSKPQNSVAYEPDISQEAETITEARCTEMTSMGSYYRTDDISKDYSQFSQTTENILQSHGFQRENDASDQQDSTLSKDEDLTFSQLKDKFESSSSRLKEKRQRNLTIDYHDLAPSTWKWNGHVAKHVQNTSDTKDAQNSHERNIDGEGHHVDSLEEGLGQGLGIILDKLRNIETKLDEIKTMEQNIWYPEIDLPTRESYMPEVGETPTATLALNKSETKNIAVAPTWPEKDLDAISLCSNDQTSLTLIANNGLENEDNEDALSVADTLPADDNLENANVIVTTPETVRASPTKEFTKYAVDITSLATSDDEEEMAFDRNARIEELAKKIMAEKQQLKKIEIQERQLAHTKDDLDTVSEGSEDEDEDHKTSERKFQNIGITIRRRRTRSASRDRSLAKIRYCWRCHQTGHENFDCTAELHPGNWCPRCLENTHWEDGCWVNEQQASLIEKGYGFFSCHSIGFNFLLCRFFALFAHCRDICHVFTKPQIFVRES